MTTFSAELLGTNLIVWDTSKGSQLYGDGYFGKPVGIAKPKTAEFDVPLVLDLIEGLYLLNNETITVSDSNGKKIGVRALRAYARKTYHNFDLNYVVYTDLRKNGYIVLPGIKFGCTYAVYERGPGIDHAPFLVSIKASKEEITSTDVVRAGRLATTVRKRFIIALPNLKTKNVHYLMFDWFKA
ncbi:MAG: tRNA-intron lyase [Candidatus Bathyarchaeota archaeon]|nr:MAG: tRNA-intron lyase [Candidatus Bathyarchaeota archaeon]